MHRVRYLCPAVRLNWTKLEVTYLKREISEEVRLEVTDMKYLESKSFIADDGEPVVDIVFLCRCGEGQAIISEPEEVAEIHWLMAQEVLEHPKAPPWTRQSIEKAEVRRLATL